MKRTLILLAATFMGGSVSIAYADSALVIESWRNDDLNIWQDTIIPAFEKAHPDIKVTFQPTAPTEYDGALSAKLDSGTAGDLITCRPFDKSLQMFQKNQLSALNDLSGMGNFSAIAKVAWTTDDGKSTFCVPMAAVIHGFFYNKDAFKKLAIQAPTTWDEFFADADKIKKDGTYTAVALGTPDQWEAAYMGYLNIGPNYWKGEDGRLALIKGTQKLTDAAWVEPMKTMARMSAMGIRRSPIRIARTCSSSVAQPSIPPALGRSPASAPAPSSNWACSRRRSSRRATLATSPITTISPLA
jgi:raffinose/stachyose/melibiose transport system substrate-binding protein